MRPALVGRSNVIASPPHSTLGPMNRYLKALNEGVCFSSAQEKFPNLNDDSVNDEVIARPQMPI